MKLSGFSQENFISYLEEKFADRDEDKSPIEFDYIRTVSFWLSVIGSWPHREFGRKTLDFILSLYNMLLIFVAFTISSAAGGYIWHYRETITFAIGGHVVLCILLELLYLQRMVIARTEKYRATVKCLINEFHLFYFKHTSEYANTVYNHIQVISRIFSISIVILIFIGVGFFTFMPLFNNYRNGMFGSERPVNGTFEHALYFYCFTDDVYTKLKPYWILFTFNIPTSFNTSSGILIFDCLLSLIVFQILGHLKIMMNNLVSIPVSDGMYTEVENMHVKRTLKDIVEHHKVIINFVDMCSDTFSEYLFVFYLFMQGLTIISLVELSAFTPDAIAKYGPITLAIYQQLILVSCLFEMISTKSEKLVDAVYEVPWQCMDTANRRTVIILLMRSQTPISLKAGGMVPVGVLTMSSVLKTTWSYYMVLRAASQQ